MSLVAESANTVFSGPTTGAAATPTFRSLAAADIPSLPYDPLLAYLALLSSSNYWLATNQFATNTEFFGKDNEAPNQTLVSGASLLTGTLADARYAPLTNVSQGVVGNAAQAATFTANQVQYFSLNTVGPKGGSTTESANEAGFSIPAPYTLTNLTFGYGGSGIAFPGTNWVIRLFTNGVYAGWSLTIAGTSSARNVASDATTSLVMNSGGLTNVYTVQISNTIAQTLGLYPWWSLGVFK